MLGDIWPPHQLGAALAIYSLAPLLGPAIGPIIGGFVTQATTWRWTFYATSIAAAVCSLVGIFGLRETYAPHLLRRKAARLRASTGNDALYTRDELGAKRLLPMLTGHLARPFVLLAAQPIIQVIAVYMAALYGILYLVFSTFAQVWATMYNEKPGVASLNYISLAVGLALGTQIGAPLNDKVCSCSSSLSRMGV